jgi:hypothetical protein
MRTAVPLLADYSGLNGFLGTRGSFMLDFVFLTMFAVVPVMAWSIYQVRYQRRFELHKRVQIILGVLLLVAVLAFEIDMRLHGWTDRAEESTYWLDGKWNDWVDYSLLVHLACAIPTAVLWITVIILAIRRFPKPPRPSEHSRSHIFWARCAAIGLLLTSVTGWVFYALAFVA